jgi:hypothetical protein
MCGIRLETGSFREGYIMTFHRWYEQQSELLATRVIANLAITADTGPYHHQAFAARNGRPGSADDGPDEPFPQPD